MTRFIVCAFLAYLAVAYYSSFMRSVHQIEADLGWSVTLTHGSR